MNNIADYIKQNEGRCFLFKPNKEFYELTRINRKRWAMIYRKDVSPTLDELAAIANYFQTTVEHLINYDQVIPKSAIENM
jgi:hypothetical protein